MAASGVNVKMGVSGVAQFKQSMNQAKQATKTLDAQLALTEKQFKASGDSESYMAEKAELLKAKMEQQNAVVESAEKALEQMTQNGVERSSTAYQNLYREMLSAKGTMVDTQTQLDNLGTAGENAATGVTEANDQLAAIGQGINYQNLTDGLDKITSGLGKIIKKAWQAGEELVRATLGAGSWADELSETAKKYSIGDWVVTEEDLQRMRKTAELVDTDVESIIAARQKLLKGKGGEDKEVWGFLHDNNIATQGRKTEDIFWDVGEAIMNMTDSAEQEATAQKVLGRSWAELKPLFETGRKEYEEMNASWNVVSQETIDSLTEMDDEYQKLSAEFETFKMELLGAFSGPLTEGMTAITGLFKEFNSYLQSDKGKEKLAQIGDTISGLITGLTEIDPAEVVAGLQGVIDAISGGLKWISENSSLVVGAMGTILAGWAALKITGTVVEITKIISALTGGLGAGTAASAGATAGASWAGSFASAAMKAAPFLAFLYTLLNPASTANNNLDVMVDENGNLTEAGKNAGFTSAEEVLGSGYYHPEWQKSEELQALQDKFNTQFTGDEADAVERNMNRLAAIHALDNMTDTANSTTSSGNTGATEGTERNLTNALRKGISGWKIVMDREAVGQMVADTVNEVLAGLIMQE